jgi:hypothetical protein
MALRVMHERTPGHGHESLGGFIQRLRTAGLADPRVARLLGSPDAADPESVRKKLNRWEREDGFRTEVDAQARADVAHAEKRVGEACRRMQIPVNADVVHFTLEADLAPGVAAGVLEYLRELVGLLEAEIRANVLHLPREGMPGARPVSWSEVRERIASLQAGLDDAHRRQVVAEYIDDREDQQHRRDMLAELHGHAREAEILNIIGDDGAASARDALGHAWTWLDDDWGHEEHKVRHRVRLMCRDRQHIRDPRVAGRFELLRDQQVGDLRIAALRPK